MSSNADNESHFATFLLGVVLTSIILGFFIGVSDDFQRKGFFYVANQNNGWVVRMDNGNGNATNITAPLATPEDAAKLSNQFNTILSGHENGH